MDYDQLFDCTVKRSQLTGQTEYISLMLDIEVSYYICSSYTSTTNLLSSCPTRSREHFNISSMQILSFRVELLLSPPASSYTSSSFPTCSSPSFTLHHRPRNKDNPGQNLLLEEPPTCRKSLLQGWQAADGW